MDEIEAREIDIIYVGVDINLASLSRVVDLNQRYHFVRCIGLRSTFDQAFGFFRHLKHDQPSLVISLLSLGSTFTNGPEQLVRTRLSQWSQIASVAILGQDGPPLADKEGSHAGYHTPAYQEFLRQGLERADSLFSRVWFSSSRQVACLIDSKPYRHVFQYQQDDGTLFPVFPSWKYTEFEMKSIVGSTQWQILTSFGRESTSMSQKPLYPLAGIFKLTVF